MTDPADVLVVGAGPTGLALAGYLAAYGVRPWVIDRSPDRAHESRALAIQPRTLEVLAGLGVTSQLTQLGNPTVTLRLHVRDRVRSVPMFGLGLADTAYPYLLFLSQAETERVLADHLQARNVVIDRGVELINLEPAAESVRATLRRAGAEHQVAVQYVVGCDGAHSSVRRLARIPFTGGSYPQTFVLADVEADGVEPGAAHVFLSDRGILFFFPLVTPASWRLLVMRPPDDPVPAAAPVALREVQALADAYTGGAVRLRDPVWMTNFRLHHRAAERYRIGRVFLAGDAAHIHSPAGAQGMNTGIQDAVNLAWKLAYTLAGHANASILDTYEQERAPIGRRVLRMSDRAFTIATSTNPVVRFARTRIAPAAIPLALRSSRARAGLVRTVAQLSINYRTSPLSVTGGRRPQRGPRAGDRLPDAAIIENGRTTTLHHHTGSPGWHLLLSGRGWPTDTANIVGDRMGLITVHRLDHLEHAQALHRLGVAPHQSALFLVRPDGHIGYRGDTDHAGLASYLDRWL